MKCVLSKQIQTKKRLSNRSQILDHFGASLSAEKTPAPMIQRTQ
jgi:hypothetical protein